MQDAQANIDTVVPPLAVAVEAWQELGLELGETAVVSGEGLMADLFCLAALWSGACPVIRLGSRNDSIPGTRCWTVPADDPEPALEQLASRLADAPAVAAVELTGTAVAADILFETIPVYSRLLLAGAAGEPLTIDYYNNIHRKGITVLARSIDPVPEVCDETDPMVRRARALVASPERMQAALDACRES